MGETIETMSVVAARQWLQNTSGMRSEQIEEAQKVVNAFHAARPRRACVACGSMIWSEHSADGDACWACDRCHRGPELTAEQWHAQETAERQAADAHLRATEAAAPDPRAHLAEALAARAEANDVVGKLDRATPVARAALAEAQSRHDRAVEGVEAANANSAENLAATFYNGTKPTDSARAAAAARGELAAATDALVVAKNAKTILDTKVKDARSALGVASDKARKAALGVLVAERLEGLLDEVAESRAQYTESTGRLAWLLKTHLIPSTDARARQLVADANTPPSAWREAATAGVRAMEDALAALLAA